MNKKIPSNDHVRPGISIRNGPMEAVDRQMTDVNGIETNGSTSKRKSRDSLAKPSYAEQDTSGEDDEPLVCVDLAFTYSLT
jgi:DNA topoisomerase I